MFIRALKRGMLIAAVAVLFFAVLAPASQACTRILWATDLGVYTGRTMDWPASTEPMLMTFPKGIERNGGVFVGHRVVKTNPVIWTSKYGSIVVSTYGAGAIDGLNERGLGVHMLFFTATDFGPRDPRKKGLQAGDWAQYLLDNAASVDQAINLMKDVQIVMVEANGHKANLHLALEDASGDSAIMEYENGKLHIYHNRKYRVMTNDPAFPEQLRLLEEKHFDFANPTRDMPLPGNVNPIDRFQRATYYLRALKQPKSDSDAVATMMSLLYNVSVPIGAPYKGQGAGDGFDAYSTEYRTITDTAHSRYFFQLATMPAVIWVDLSKIDFSKGAPVLELNPDNPKLFGNVTELLKQVKSIPF
ncbi:MAG: linear amide C-N hydrolase [Gammaproteobacteria bacterium]